MIIIIIIIMFCLNDILVSTTTQRDGSYQMELDRYGKLLSCCYDSVESTELLEQGKNSLLLLVYFVSCY